MSLKSELANVLPQGKQYEVFHFQSKPRETHSLVSQRSKDTNLKTVKIEHFISLVHEGQLFFAIELFIYVTINYDENTTEKLLFVSKADTNGQNTSNVKIHQVTRAILDYVLKIPTDTYLREIIPKEPIQTTDSNAKVISKSTGTKEALHILIERHQGKLIKPEVVQPYTITDYPRPVKSKISLFTRSEPQYLFPSSSENKNKHVLGGDGLLKWWLKLLDQVIGDNYIQDETLDARLQIPAEDPRQIERFLKPLQCDKWKVGDIFDGKDDDLALYKIPLFPDDPKARFLEHLVVDNRAKNVNLKQFWVELQARQEFRLGVTVSVIGIEGTLKQSAPDSHSDSILLSRRHFKKLKNYITGEDYAESEGSFEAYRNITNYLESQLDAKSIEITGKYVKPSILTTTTPNSSSVNVLTPVRRKKNEPVVQNLTSMVRKKQKK